MSVQSADVRRHMDQLLNEESSLLAELEQTLRQEADVVRGNDPDAIERIGASRHHCVDTLTRLDAERSSTCRMLSFGSGANAFDQLLRWCDSSRSLRERWLGNLQAARRCKDLNDRNGAVVTLKLTQVQQLLSAMWRLSKTDG